MENAVGLDNLHRIKMGLLLLGSFIIAFITATFLHEACHAGAAAITGGHAGDIVIHPFNWSYSYSCPSKYPVFHIAAGAIGSSLIALTVYIILIRWTKPLLLPLLLLGPISLFHSGGYWLIDILQGIGGDACRLIDKGIPTAVILCTCIALLLIGIILTIHLMRTLGVTNESFRTRFIILAIGIFPYAMAVIIWNWFYDRQEFTLWLICGLVSIGLIIPAAVFLGFFKTRKSCIFSPTWPIITGINAFAIGLVIALLWINSGKVLDIDLLFSYATPGFLVTPVGL